MRQRGAVLVSTQLVHRLETLNLWAVLGPIAPLVCLLACWWGTFAWLPEKYIPFCAMSGLAFGLLVTALFVPGWVHRSSTFSWRTWAAIYLFYVIGAWGVFMGMPAGILVLALPTGLIVGAKLSAQPGGPAEAEAIIRRARRYTTGVFGVFCLFSAILALSHPHIGAELQRMLGLDSAVTLVHVVILIIVGGGILLLLNWLLVGAVARWTLRQHAPMLSSSGASDPGDDR